MAGPVLELLSRVLTLKGRPLLPQASKARWHPDPDRRRKQARAPPRRATRRRMAALQSAGEGRSACNRFVYQAEDGIRDLSGTGVQTCALPILVAEDSVGQATAILTSDGFIVRRGARVHSNTVPKGKVVGTSPAGRVSKGTTITLLISSGPDRKSVV